MNFSEKLKTAFKEYVAKTNTLWEAGKYIHAIIRVVGPSIMFALVLILITQTIVAITRFLRLYYAQLICGILGICAFIGWCDSRKDKKIKWDEEERKKRAQQRYMAQLEYTTTKDATYIEQGKLLFAVAPELRGLGIVPPTRLSNIYSPTRTIPKMDGAVAICQFLFQKDSETVDVELLRHTLQTKIDQRLTAGEFPGIPEKFIYNGHVYSGFCVDSVRDSQGYVEVYTALTNEAYCRYKQNRDLNNDMFISPIDRRDIDY